MEQYDDLLKKRNELQQLIKNQEELYQRSLFWGGQLPANIVHPADLTGHLQVLNIELDRINHALEQYGPDQLS